MSISSEISRIANNISDSLTAVAAKGVTVPAGSNSDDLAELIAEIDVPEAGTITNNTTLPAGSTSSGTVNRGSYIKIGAGSYNNDLYYHAQGNSGTMAITTSDDAGIISVDGYANINVTGINIPVPESGTNTFSVTVPNGTNDTVIFTFTVDANGNTTIE